MATVLSTISGTAASAHVAAIPATSLTRKVGFARVSISTTLVSGRMACSTARASGSTRVEEIPYRANDLVTSENVPPYSARWATMWSPAPRIDVSVVCNVAIPLPNDHADSAPSSDASTRWRAVWVGPPYRPYT